MVDGLKKNYTANTMIQIFNTYSIFILLTLLAVFCVNNSFADEIISTTSNENSPSAGLGSLMKTAIDPLMKSNIVDSPPKSTIVDSPPKSTIVDSAAELNLFNSNIYVTDNSTNIIISNATNTSVGGIPFDFEFNPSAFKKYIIGETEGNNIPDDRTNLAIDRNLANGLAGPDTRIDSAVDGNGEPVINVTGITTSDSITFTFSAFNNSTHADFFCVIDNEVPTRCDSGFFERDNLAIQEHNFTVFANTTDGEDEMDKTPATYFWTVIKIDTIIDSAKDGDGEKVENRSSTTSDSINFKFAANITSPQEGTFIFFKCILDNNTAELCGFNSKIGSKKYSDLEIRDEPYIFKVNASIFNFKDTTIITDSTPAIFNWTIIDDDDDDGSSGGGGGGGNDDDDDDDGSSGGGGGGGKHDDGSSGGGGGGGKHDGSSGGSSGGGKKDKDSSGNFGGGVKNDKCDTSGAGGNVIKNEVDPDCLPKCPPGGDPKDPNCPPPDGQCPPGGDPKDPDCSTLSNGECPPGSDPKDPDCLPKDGQCPPGGDPKDPDCPASTKPNSASNTLGGSSRGGGETGTLLDLSNNMWLLLRTDD
ncbi:MAG TPA: hypothetical protein VFV86_01520 [Nitrososphaeraceae archaeon]|nr:hypothetical protein [Nitrososphaeraceae archaeon]